MVYDVKSVVKHFKAQFPNKKISVRFVSKMPKGGTGVEDWGDAAHYADGSWRIRIHKRLTAEQQVHTLIHEFAHVSRGIPSRKDPHDDMFYTHLGLMNQVFDRWLDEHN